MTSAPFRFVASRHEYIHLPTGDVRPHITGLLKSGGYVDERWYKDEASKRGKAVHQVTADYDLEALDVASCVSSTRPYLLAHIAAMAILKPEIVAVEEALMHPDFLIGGRPDRVWKVRGGFAVCEIKSGGEEEGHPIQTALQAILIAPGVQLPAWSILRYVLYIGANGRYKVRQHKERGDIDKAIGLIKRFA